MVLLGRDAIIAASTNSAPTLSAYVSADARSTAESLVQLGAAPSRIASGSGAHTACETPPHRRLDAPASPGIPLLLITAPERSHAPAKGSGALAPAVIAP